jgi:hypothetical protein
MGIGVTFSEGIESHSKSSGRYLIAMPLFRSEWNMIIAIRHYVQLMPKFPEKNRHK